MVAKRQVFLQHNTDLCETVHEGDGGGDGYSHQCHLSRECQRGLEDLVGLEVQVDPSGNKQKTKVINNCIILNCINN